MAKSVRTVDVGPGLLTALEALAPRCFLCRWILEDVKKNGKLTGYPMDYNDQPEFPVTGKICHLELEGLIPKLDPSKPA